MTIYWQWGEIKNSGFSNEWQNGYIEVSADAGSPFRRERFSDIRDIISGTFTLTKAEYLNFMSWYKEDIRQGARTFQYYDCRVEDYRTARIIDKPTQASNSTFFDISITLMLDPYTKYEQNVAVANPDLKILVNPDLEMIVGRELNL